MQACVTGPQREDRIGADPPSLVGFNSDTPDETFLRWIFWDKRRSSVLFSHRNGEGFH
jgi:hypothetical protein